jgi:hypothetical protein
MVLFMTSDFISFIILQDSSYFPHAMKTSTNAS